MDRKLGDKTMCDATAQNVSSFGEQRSSDKLSLHLLKEKIMHREFRLKGTCPRYGNTLWLLITAPPGMNRSRKIVARAMFSSGSFSMYAISGAKKTLEVDKKVSSFWSKTGIFGKILLLKQWKTEEIQFIPEL